MKVTIVDPPSGWLYGFPKVFDFKGSILLPGHYEKDLEKWFIDNGYPEKDIDLAMQYSRYWTEEVEA